MPPSDIAITENPRAVIGGNAPPGLTPFEIAEKAVCDIYAEAIMWLDGHTIDSRELADGVANLLAKIREAEKLADETRVAEKAPLDEAIKEIQARYAPLIGDTKAVKGKTVLASAACKKALQPWLQAEDRRLKEEARLAREEADRRRRDAEEALRATQAADLAARAEAEALLSAAKKAETIANVTERQTAKAGGIFGRSASLRTTFVPSITDPVLVMRHYWINAREEMLTFVTGLVERDIRLGRRDIPGVEVTETRIAV